MNSSIRARRHWPRCTAFALGAAGWLFAHSVAAQAVHLDTGGDRCLDVEQLEQRIRNRAEEVAPELSVTVTLQPQSQPRSIALRVEVERSGQHAERELQLAGGDCDALHDAVALVAVMLAQTLVDVAPTTTAPPVAVAAEAAVTPAPAVVDRSEGSAKPSSPPAEDTGDEVSSPPAQFSLGLGAAVRDGLAPRPAAWPYFALAMRWQGRGSLQLRGGLSWPQRVAVAEGELRIASYGLGLGACVVPISGAPGLALCADVHALLAVAAASGFAVENRTRSKPMLFADVRLEYELEALSFGASRFSLWVDAGIVAVRPRFVVRTDEGADAGVASAREWAAALGALYSFVL